jgi:hypothetical protein
MRAAMAKERILMVGFGEFWKLGKRSKSGERLKTDGSVEVD